MFAAIQGMVMPALVCTSLRKDVKKRAIGEDSCTNIRSTEIFVHS